MPREVFPKSQIIHSRAKLKARSSDPVFSVFISAVPLALHQRMPRLLREQACHTDALVEVGFSGRGSPSGHSVQAGAPPSRTQYTLLYPHKVVVYF